MLDNDLATRRRWLIGLTLAVLAGVVVLVMVDDPPGGVGWAGAALLGVVEGITEYLPVSSTGHLAVVADLRWSDAGESLSRALDSYLIVIQAGAIVAVFGLYWRRFRDMIVGLFSAGDGRNLALAMIVAFIPAGLAGLFLGDLIKERLFGLVPIAWAWIVGGLVILWVERDRPLQADAVELEELTRGRALLIGIAQVLALWPGVSRSLVTILGGRAVGLTTRAAVEFSFLLGAATLLVASIYEGAGNLDSIVTDIGARPAVIGFVVATISAAAAARWLVTYLSRHSLAIFGWYRIAIGVIALVFLVG